MNVKVEPRSTFTFTPSLSHTLPLFHLRTENLGDSGIQKLSSQNTRNGVPEREQLKTFWAGACGHQNPLAACAFSAPLIRRS